MPNGSGINPSEMTVRENRPVARRRQRCWANRRIDNPMKNHKGKTKKATMICPRGVVKVSTHALRQLTKECNTAAPAYAGKSSPKTAA